MTKTKTTNREVYVIGLEEMGGCWLGASKFYSDRKLAEKLVEERRLLGEKCKLFTLFEYEEVLTNG